MNPGAEGAEKFFEHCKWSKFFFTKYMANDDFSEPPQHADSKNPIFIFCRFLGLGHLRGPGVSLGSICGVPSIQPFFWRGGASQGALSTPPAAHLKARPPQPGENQTGVAQASGRS